MSPPRTVMPSQVTLISGGRIPGGGAGALGWKEKHGLDNSPTAFNPLMISTVEVPESSIPVVGRLPGGRVSLGWNIGDEIINDCGETKVGEGLCADLEDILARPRRLQCLLRSLA